MTLTSAFNRQGRSLIARERLYLDVTRTKVLKHGDEELKNGGVLLVAKDGEIPEEEVKRLGIEKMFDPETASAEKIASRSTRIPRNLETR